jgi:outer membrane protein insertion porin family
VKAEDVRVSAVEGIGLPDATHRIRGFELRSIVDTQDQTPFPRNGIRHEFIYETATDALNSDISYVRLLLSMEWFNTIGRHTFHPRFIFGSSDNTLPPVRWFRLGGIDSFYGYYRDQVRGGQVLLISGEYIFRIPWRPVSPLLLALRYDWGGSWQDSLSFALKDMIGGVGIKMAIDSPVGPLEVAYGIREGGYGKLYFCLGFHW